MPLPGRFCRCQASVARLHASNINPVETEYCLVRGLATRRRLARRLLSCLPHMPNPIAPNDIPRDPIPRTEAPLSGAGDSRAATKSRFEMLLIRAGEPGFDDRDPGTDPSPIVGSALTHETIAAIDRRAPPDVGSREERPDTAICDPTLSARPDGTVKIRARPASPRAGQCHRFA